MSEDAAMEREQDQNTAKLLMGTFHKIVNRDGVTATDIARYLRQKFGDVWRLNILTEKAEETLNRSMQLGFLDRRGNRYISKLAKSLKCVKRRRQRRGCPCGIKKRKRRSRCAKKSSRRRKRKSPCCCRKN